MVAGRNFGLLKIFLHGTEKDLKVAFKKGSVLESKETAVV
jgi:hypothetical protein